ncbi:hypothetical protein OH799_28985 [Nocardia sp. NBC_00881]|uniref:hypothetical protein n=1 Tax=Nocardia sp. NBC_00881 TaxID=2975995 RepID=UPI00386FF734|nr:hypothetical protein OH799_28985 [Nocardia sp. NBC_00881]
MAVAWQGKTIDAILDEGSYGLQYWIEFMPLYEAAFGGNGGRGNLAKLLAMYDEQRGMRVEKLEQAGEALKTALAEVDSQWDAQRSYTGRLPDLWQGAAADAALDMLSKQSVLAAEDRQLAQAAWKTIDPMANSLRQSAGAKAEAALGLLEDSGNGSRVVKIDGKTPEDVKVIVDVHSAHEWISGNQVRDLGRIFPTLAGPDYQTTRKQKLTGVYGEKIRNTVNDWLQNPFKRDFDAKLTRYIDVCTQTDGHFKLQYQNLAGALAAVSDHAYPRPEGPSKPSSGKPDNQSQPGSPARPGTPGTPSTPTVPAGTTPSAVPASTALTTPNTPTTLAPKMPSLDGLAALNQLAKEFSPLTTGLTQAVNQGVTALTGSIKSGIDGAIEKLRESIDPKNADTDDPDKKDRDGKPKAEFDIAGKHVKFEMGPDGQVKLVLSDAEGRQQEFDLELDEHGVPVISMHEPKEPAPPAETPAPETPGKDKPVDTTPVPEPNIGQPGVPTGTPPTTRREEDGEHWPNPIPEQGEPESESPFDSGAELAEAGPL